MNFSNNKVDFELEVIDKVFNGVLIDNGFKIRESQIEMVQDILQLMSSDEKYLLCEAEVGTGKSFAYLIPLLAKQQSKLFGCSIVISTATISLQEQVLKDIRFLVKLLNLNTEVILSKGSTHFLCTKRLNEHFRTNKAPAWTQYWKNISPYGDKVELIKQFPEINRYWNRINVKGCTFTNCNYYNECPYTSLRSELRERRKFIVTNHDQLIAHAQKIYSDDKPIFPPDIEFIAIDEAHNLEEKAFNALTINFSEKAIIDTLTVIDVHLSRSFSYSEIQPVIKTFNKNIVDLFETFTVHFETMYQKSPYQHDTSRIHLPGIDKTIINNIIKELEEILEALYFSDREGRTSEQILAAQRKFEELTIFFTDLRFERNIFWLEKIKNDVGIWSVPKEIDDILRETFFGMDGPKFILTSGTITQNAEDTFGRYLYYLISVGLDMVPDRSILLAEPKLSPYSYEQSTMLYISSDLPHPTNERDAFRKQSIEELIRLISLTDGRAMVLFTSKDDLKFVHAELKQRKLPWTMLVQDNESSQQQVIEAFKNDEKSILLSTGIFWEGIDIKGPALSNLIIYRLPFPTPDPVSDYKKELAFSDEHFLLETQVPKMIIRLRQGIGRLIRHETDEGIVSILDPRLGSKKNNKYKEMVIKSIRLGEITENFGELLAYTKKLKINKVSG